MLTWGNSTQESPQIQEERKLERRGWAGCLLVFLLAGVTIALVTALPLSLFPVDPAQPAWLALVSFLLSIAVTFVVGIGGLVLMFRLLSWSLEAERGRQVRGTAILRQMLPGLGLEHQAPMSTPAFSSRQLARLLLLFLVYLATIVLIALAVSTFVDRVLSGLPGIVSSVLTIAVFLGILFLGERTIGRLRTKPGAVSESLAKSQRQERPKPGRSRLPGVVIYFTLTLVPLIGVVSLIVRIPVSPPLIPILVLGVCSVIFVTITAIYVITPFLWVIGAVRRGEQDRAIVRARLVERLSILPGFYLNLHGVILLWAGRYEEARRTFEESIGEQRKEVMGGGSAALENIGCVLAWQGQYEEAIKMFEGSIAIAPQQAMVYCDLPRRCCIRASTCRVPWN